MDHRPTDTILTLIRARLHLVNSKSILVEKQPKETLKEGITQIHLIMAFNLPKPLLIALQGQVVLIQTMEKSLQTIIKEVIILFMKATMLERI
jgi:hypothetical protein